VTRAPRVAAVLALAALLAVALLVGPVALNLLALAAGALLALACR
jgi:hypothetical protein